MLMTENKLNKNLMGNNFSITHTDKKIDYRVVEKLEESLDALKKLHNNISNNFLSFKKDFDEFLLESASYFAKTMTESPNISMAGLPQRIQEKLLKSKPKGKVTLSVSTFDFSFIKDFEFDFKSTLEPLQELFIFCDESLRPGDFKIESENNLIVDSFDANLQKLIELLKNSSLITNDSNTYEFNNKNVISEKLNNLKYINGFDLLNEIDSDIIANIIGNEDPILIAAILSRLPEEKSLEILNLLNSEKRNESYEKIKELKNIPSDIIEKVEKTIYRLFESKLYEEYIFNDGINYLTEVIKNDNNFYSKVLHKNLKKDYPHLFSKILKNDDDFDELSTIDDRGIQKLIKKIRRTDLVIALTNASSNLINKFLSNMSSGAIKLFYEEMNLIKEITDKEIISKRKYIYQLAKEMHEKGELSFENDNDKNI